MSKKPFPQPAPYDDADTVAIRALNSGTANEGQQIRAINWIIYKLCRTYDLPFRPEGDRETAFACGMQFVGQQIVKQTKLTTSANPKP